MIIIYHNDPSGAKPWLSWVISTLFSSPYRQGARAGSPWKAVLEAAETDATELASIPGIGPRRLQQIRAHAKVRGCEGKRYGMIGWMDMIEQYWTCMDQPWSTYLLYIKLYQAISTYRLWWVRGLNIHERQRFW